RLELHLDFLPTFLEQGFDGLLALGNRLLPRCEPRLELLFARLHPRVDVLLANGESRLEGVEIAAAHERYLCLREAAFALVQLRLSCCNARREFVLALRELGFELFLLLGQTLLVGSHPRLEFLRAFAQAPLVGRQLGLDLELALGHSPLAATDRCLPLGERTF